MAQADYEHAFRERIRAIYPGGDISKINMLPDDTAERILREILETGCLSGNYSNIEIAHEALAEIPPKWLLEHLPEVVPACLFKEPEWLEWEFRRLAEMLRGRFPDAFAWFVEYAGKLHDPEVDEAVAELSVMTNEQRAEQLIGKYGFDFERIPKEEIIHLIEEEIADHREGSSEYIRLLCGYLFCLGDSSDVPLLEKAKYGINMDVGCMIDGEWIESLKNGGAETEYVNEREKIVESFVAYYRDFEADDVW